MKPRLSLKARALQLLAQREHSRLELRRKLLRHAREACAADNSSAMNESSGVEDAGPCLDKLLDWLQSHNYLSEERFVESRVHARAARFGTRRIAHELSQHGVMLDADAAVRLQSTEYERAQALWERKFKTPAADAVERARQMRFLTGRGFASDVIRRVVRAAAADLKD